MHFPKSWPGFVALLHDVLMAGASLWLAYWLRLGDTLMPFSGYILLNTTFPFMLFALVVFVGSGLYRGLWRYASMQDLLTLARASFLLLLLFYLCLFLLTRLEGTPRSVPVIHWLLLLAMLGGPRFLYRTIKDRRLGLDFTLAGPPKVPVLLIGANDAAELFIRESKRNRNAAYHVVGLVEDDDSRRGQQVHGVRIYGATDSLAKIITKLERKGRKPQRVVLAESRPGGARTRDILAVCEEHGLTLSRIPQTLELQSGIAPNSLEVKPIAVEDLLRRAQKVHDRSGMESLVRGKKVLVTGAGGSIGSELCRQIASFEPKMLVLLELSEYALYQIEREMVDRGDAFPVIPMLGDVRDRSRMEAVFAQHQPQLVFHAAALKHVPLAEANPLETITTNALGTQVVAELSAEHKAEAMVLISTDKAVHPSSVMGATKRLAEKVMQAMATDKKVGTHTRFLAVRFGNVLGSTGSVVPRFQAQLESGGPITVTHPDMTRYFMTIREAVELVIQAASLGQSQAKNSNHIYILDMGEPVKIDDLARQMIRLAGLTEQDIAITYTGLRPGEKLHEELTYASEALNPTSHAAIQVTKPENVPLSTLKKVLKSLLTACAQQDREAALVLLRKAVPEYAE